MKKKDKREILKMTAQIKVSRFGLRRIDNKDLNKKLSVAEIDDTPIDEDKQNFYSALQKLDDAVTFLDKIKYK